MVTVTVFFEGGANPTSNPNAETVENTTHLRESFNKLLNAGLPQEQVRIQAEPAYSITNIVHIRQENALLLMDLDDTKDKKIQRLTDNKLLDIQDFVFFMVQRMEAWILSQPEVIEQVFANFKVTDKKVAEDTKIAGKHPEDIRYPDEVLSTILQRFFSYEKAGKMKKLKYGKLKIAPQLIENLDIQKLVTMFEDVEALLHKVKTQVIS